MLKTPKKTPKKAVTSSNCVICDEVIVRASGGSSYRLVFSEKNHQVIEKIDELLQISSAEFLPKDSTIHKRCFVKIDRLLQARSDVEKIKRNVINTNKTRFKRGRSTPSTTPIGKKEKRHNHGSLSSPVSFPLSPVSVPLSMSCSNSPVVAKTLKGNNLGVMDELKFKRGLDFGTTETDVENMDMLSLKTSQIANETHHLMAETGEHERIEREDVDRGIARVLQLGLQQDSCFGRRLLPKPAATENVPSNAVNTQIPLQATKISDPALHEAALQEGAIQAGGSDIISQIENGLINNSDFDHVVCTPDIVTDLVPIRKILRDSFPMQPKGSLGLDMKEMVHRFTKGKTFNSFPGDSEAEGFLTVTVGRLDMAAQQLHANLEAYVKAIASMKPGGRFILNSVMTCHPSPEMFPIKIDDLLPEVKRKVKAKKAKDTKDNEDIKDNENVGESSVNEEKAAIASAS